MNQVIPAHRTANVIYDKRHPERRESMLMLNVLAYQSFCFISSILIEPIPQAPVNFSDFDIFLNLDAGPDSFY